MWKRLARERRVTSPGVSCWTSRPTDVMPARAAVRSGASVGIVLSVVLSTVPSRAQTPVQAGFRDFSYGTAANTPSGEKPESKLWWNDGVWWGSLISPDAAQYRIHRFDAAAQAWVDTGTALDTRANSRADVLWDQASQRLYVVSHVLSTNARATAANQWGRLFRYTYNSTTKQYTLDPGFPVNVTRGNAEALTIAKDINQRLWVTCVQDGKVKINWSLSDDWEWGVPIDLPVSATDATVSTDDISAILAFGNGNVGVMWSNQLTGKIYFAFRRDTNPPDVWEPVEAVLPGVGCSGACADDHLSLRTDQTGRVFAAVKTSLEGSTDPLVMLVVRATTGEWAAHTVGLKRDHHTRPLLVLDEQKGQLFVFATSDENGGAIYVKTSPVEPIAFAPGLGEPFIKSATDVTINNATSIKQNVNGTTGLLVLASDQNTHFYLHNFVQLGTPPPATPPASPVNPGATVVSSSRIDLAWTDASNNEDAFHIERASSGAFAEIATVGANVVGYSDTTVTAGTSYTYRVRARNAAGFSGYSGTASATTPGSGPNLRIKDITFEGGSLTHVTTGADRVVGTVSLENGSPLKGAYALRVQNAATSYLQEGFTATDDLYVSAYLRLNALPAGDVRVLQISNAGVTVGSILLRATGRLRLRAGSTAVGVESASLQVGQLYRIGIHQRRGTGATAVLEAFVATGDNAFGAPFAALSTGTFTTAADRLRFGSTASNAADLVLDDVRLDAAAMPEPSQ